MKEVVIVSAARTAVGAFNGSLSGFSAPQIGSFAIKEAVNRAGIKPEEIDEVLMSLPEVKAGIAVDAWRTGN